MKNNKKITSATKQISRLFDILLLDDDDNFPKLFTIRSLLNEIENENLLYGILALLICQGILNIEEQNIIIRSKYARLSLCAMQKWIVTDFGLQNILMNRDDESKAFYRDFTGNYEFVRTQLKNDIIPIHSRHIVNVVIRGKRYNGFKLEDVFLHVYHKSWNEYHLVGLGQRYEIGIEELAKKAMFMKLGLNIDGDYEFDPDINPNVVDYTRISKTQGALTKYYIHTKIVKKVNVDLNKHLLKHIRKSSDLNSHHFQWFTIDEINEKSKTDNRIMESSKKVFESLPVDIIPICINEAEDYETYNSFFSRCRRFVFYKLNIGKYLLNIKPRLVVIAILLFLVFIFKNIYTTLDDPSPLLDNLNNFSGIIEAFITLLSLVIPLNRDQE